MQSPRQTSAPPGGGVVATRPSRRLDYYAIAEGMGPRIVGSVLPFMLVLYLALKAGGYETVVYGEVGIAAWWLLLLGALVGVLPVARITTAGWIALGLLTGFAIWTALGIGWSESAERSVTEVGRVASYLGVLALALAAQGREGLRRTVCAVGAAIGLVALLALLSRFYPNSFPANETAHLLRGVRARLSYPLDYWNGLAALIAVGVPLLLVIATYARHLITRACAVAAAPALALAAYYTLSRGGALELGVALIALLALHPRRLTLLATAAAPVAGAAILIAAATQRDALEDGLLGQAAQTQGDEMLAMTIVVCAGVGLVHAALALASRYGLGPRISLTRTASRATGAIAVLAVVVVAVAAGLPEEASDRWQEFKNERSPGVQGPERFGSGSGTGRYQLWEAALDANATDRLTGIGPGTFEFWEAREGSIPTFVRDAHSLYFESLAEVGVVGVVLIGGLVLWILFSGAQRSLSRGSPDRRAWIAGATAACAAFATAALVDWVWELAVLPVAFVLLAAAIIGPDAESRRRRTSRFHRGSTGPKTRLALAGAAVAALIGIAIPLATSSLLLDSESGARSDQLDRALEDARSARNVAPFAASPTLQEALVLEARGDLAAAAASATEATEAESSNWRTWLTLSRIEARRGRAEQAVAAYREARSLNPLSPLFPQEAG